MPQHRVDMHAKEGDVKKLVADVREQMQDNHFFSRFVFNREEAATTDCKFPRATCDRNSECCSNLCAGHRCK